MLTASAVRVGSRVPLPFEPSMTRCSRQRQSRHRRSNERVMGAKKAKTAQKTSTQQKHVCPDCGSDARIVMFAGYGDRGLFWVCDKACGYKQRTR